MKTSADLLDGLRRTMVHFLGQTFTEAMRQKIRADVTELMGTAFEEGQCAMAPLICSNEGSSSCPQWTDGLALEDYSVDGCRECSMKGGFSI